MRGVIVRRAICSIKMACRPHRSVLTTGRESQAQTEINSPCVLDQTMDQTMQNSKYRKVLLHFIAALLFIACLALVAPTNTSAQDWDPQRLGAPLMRDPIWVYNNWSSYDEL